MDEQKTKPCRFKENARSVETDFADVGGPGFGIYELLFMIWDVKNNE